MTYDRWFLLGEKRNELLARWEVEQYGRDNFSDPDYIAIYGLAPREWYARGVRILGRTAVECTRDRLADRIGRDVAAIAGSASSVVVDLFAGSANTLHWIGDPDADLLIVFVAPPWGRALDPESGLDLRRTQPPVADVIDTTTSVLGRHKLLFAVQIYETVDPASLAELTARFPWFETMIYDINSPGQNAGLLVATHGWTPA